MVYCWFHWLYKAVLTAGQQLLSILIGRVGDVLDVFFVMEGPVFWGFGVPKKGHVFFGWWWWWWWCCRCWFFCWFMVAGSWYTNEICTSSNVNAISYGSSKGHSNLICLFSGWKSTPQKQGTMTCSTYTLWTPVSGRITIFDNASKKTHWSSIG